MDSLIDPVFIRILNAESNDLIDVIFIELKIKAFDVTFSDLVANNTAKIDFFIFSLRFGRFV